MTNHWADLQNAKVFLIEGSNAAENHVMAMKWIRKAQEKGAKIIHVDPRFNRTSSIADIFARIRPGADIAFLGAIIIASSERAVRRGVREAAHERAPPREGRVRLRRGRLHRLPRGQAQVRHRLVGVRSRRRVEEAAKAASLDDPRCVFAKLKQHFARYTLEVGEEISGVPAEQIKLIAETFANNRPGTILYALGMTQHTVGIQNIRCYGILQLLLGNIGKPGGGVNALRGEPNVQGACDMSVLNGYMFGYINAPNHNHPTLEAWTKDNGTFRRKFTVNGLKAWFGDNATAENDFGWKWLPKKNGAKDYTVYGMIDDAYAGKLKLLWAVGQNPMVTNPNLNYVHEALSKLEMLVVQELWDTETASFWQRPGADPKSIQTEVLLLPAAYFMEKEGTISGSGRLVQWRYEAVKPPGQAKADLEIIDTVFRKVRDLYAGSTDPKDEPLQKAVWSYPRGEHGRGGAPGDQRPRPEGGHAPGRQGAQAGRLRRRDRRAPGGRLDLVGRLDLRGRLRRGKNLSKRRDAKTDPSGLGMFPGLRVDLARQHDDPLQPRLLRRDGKPWAGTTPVIWWDATEKKWKGVDTPDVPDATTGPTRRRASARSAWPARASAGSWPPPTRTPTRRRRDLPRDGSYVPKDGPFPEFYEPIESPVANVLHPKVQHNPCVKYPRVPGKQPIGTAKDFPYVLMTSSVAGALVRRVHDPQRAVAQRARPELRGRAADAARREAAGEGRRRVKVSSARGEMEVKAVVTKRMHAADRRAGRARRLDALQLGVQGALDGSVDERPDHRRG